MTPQPDKQKIEAEYKIQNVVATATVEIDGKLDLVNINRTLVDTEYNPERFPGVVLKLEEPRASLLIFSTGKMVITGMRAESDVPKVVEALKKELKRASIEIDKINTEVVNIVASGKMDVRIDLNMASLLLENAMFEPEVFPGLIWRIQDPKAVFLLFSTGAFVCTGVKRANLVAEAVEKLLDKAGGIILNEETKDFGDEGFMFL